MAESMPDSRSGDPGSKASVGRRVPAGAPEQTLPKMIIVTGTPGVGKTAVGKLLAKRIGSEFLSLGDLVKTQGLHKGFDRRARSYIIDATGKSPGNLVREILMALHKGKGWSMKSLPNWLGKYDPVLLSRRIL